MAAGTISFNLFFSPSKEKKEMDNAHDGDGPSRRGEEAAVEPSEEIAHHPPAPPDPPWQTGSLPPPHSFSHRRLILEDESSSLGDIPDD